MERFRVEGSAGMIERSSRPKTSPKQTKAAVADAIAVRRQPLTGEHIAMQTGVSEGTVSRVLTRAGLSRLKDLEPAEPVRRYEREHPGELIHLNIKKLGRIGSVGAASPGDILARSTAISASAGSSSTSASTMPRASLSSKSCPTSAGERCHLPRSCHRLLRQPQHQSAARDDRQRPKSGRKWSLQSRSLCSSACSCCVTLVKSSNQAASTGKGKDLVHSKHRVRTQAALTVLNTSF